MVHTETEAYGDLGDLPSVDDIQKRINDRYDKLFYYDKERNRHPYVCSVCNELIPELEDLVWLSTDKLKKNANCLRWEHARKHPLSSVPKSLQEQYVFEDIDDALPPGTTSWMKSIALSPRGVAGRKTPHSKIGVSCCSSCNNSVTNNKTPYNSIVNGNYVGCAPKELTDLTPVELALLSPVKGYGYCFSYGGGKQMQLKGTMTFMRVEEKKIARSAAQVEELTSVAKPIGVSECVVVLLNGKMTLSQKERARNTIRVEKLMTAVEWLIENNVNWRSTDLETYRNEFKEKSPVIIDKSEIVESENENIEKQDLFKCYFPDGTLDEHQGGLESREAFQKYVQEMAKDGRFNIDLKLDLEKKFAMSDDDVFVSGCLLQFPYGVGGLKEKRLSKAGDQSVSESSDVEGFVRHLNRLSFMEFQEPMFQLICYSMICKLKLIRRSRLQLRGKQTANSLANGLTAQDLSATTRAHAVGNRHGGTAASRKLLSAVDACSQALPHTNQASKSARSTNEAMQHHFGIPSIFFTVTFDDENSLLMQILHGTEIDTDDDLKNISDDECANRLIKRRELRLNYPGYAAKNFSLLLNICIEEVIGWNMRKNEPSKLPGLFGLCHALSIAFEEQGRTTVHAHGSAWYKKLRRMQNRMFFAKAAAERKTIAKVLEDFHERVVSTSLFETNWDQDRWTWRQAFDHKCTVEKEKRAKPVVVNEQQLRNLRHKLAHAETNGTFAMCPHCNKGFTNEALLQGYINASAEYQTCRPLPTAETASASELEECDKPQIPKARMYAKIIQFQRKRDADVDTDTPALCVNACYQHHASCHVRGCFKCNKVKGGGHICGPQCECRYRLPDRARPNAKVRTLDDSVDWYEWNGTVQKQPLLEFLPKRGECDQFQNSCCRAISLSKFSCNSNASFITDGPVGMYQFKYQTKDTQADDSAPYHEVEMSIKSMTNRTHDDDGKEAARIIMRAAFAHNKKNIVGPAMASFLNERGSRFYFSHEFIYFPVKDIISLLNQESVDGTARYDRDGNMYFENQALHYLCRSTELEDVSAKEFYEVYVVKNVNFQAKMRNRKSSTGEEDMFAFVPDTGHFKHPSSRKKRKEPTTTPQSTPRRRKNNATANRNRTPSTTGKRKRTGTPIRRTPNASVPETPSNAEELECREGVTYREERLRIKVPQWMIPDAQKFKNNILTCSLEDVTNDMEIYAQLLLAMFLPHRCLSDLQEGTHKPFTSMLRKVAADDLRRETLKEPALIFCDENKEFLQNIQNSAYNSMRYKVGKDDLASVTHEFDNFKGVQEATQEEEEPEDDEGETAYDLFMDYVDSNANPTDKDPAFLQHELKNLSFQTMRLAGKNLCGYNEDIPTPVLEHDITMENDFVKYDVARSTAQTQSNNNNGGNNRRNATLREIVELIFTRSTLRAREKVFKKNPTAKVPDANGSVKSIIAWSEAAELDKLQSRAFQSITASFLLTFFDHEGNDLQDDAATSQHNRRYRHAKQHLMKLKGSTNKNDSQLIMLMHGPGGSGKSTVINLVVAYAKEYMSHLELPWSPQTIVITAMSGVAATLLHGQTTHSALGLRRQKAWTNDEIEVFKDARLIFVDECSFGAQSDFEKMNSQLRKLTQKFHHPFGKRSMIFVGDFSQLEPPGRVPIYHDGNWCHEFHGFLNAFIELDGMHRFEKDLPWGERLLRFRCGIPTLNDIKQINAECVISEEHKPPVGIQVACFANKDRDAVNCATFEDFCVRNKPADNSLFFGAVLVLMDNLEMENKVPGQRKGETVGITSNAVKSHFYSTCGENDCRYGENNSSRVDPVLKLYPNCPMMLTANKDVPNGQANGSRTFLQDINIKAGEQPMIIELECGTKVRAFFASQVSSLKLKHEAEDIVPQTFDAKPEKFSFTASITIEGERKCCKMNGHQFPIVSNTATTGHKLQGCTALSLLVNDWYYGQNWAYVVLSRVRTMKGLHLKQPLSEDLTKYAMSDDMKRMLKEFDNNLKLDEISDATYSDILNAENMDLTTDGASDNTTN